MDYPVFIVACDRSGTTLLRLMLNQSHVLHIGSGSGFLDRLRKYQKIYGDFTQAYQRYFFIRDLQTNKATTRKYSFKVFDLTVEEAEAAIASAAPTSFAGAAAALFQARSRKYGKIRWGDKTTRYIFDLSWLADAYPTAKFVHLIRDGRDVAVSLIKAGWVNSFRKAAHYWQSRVEAGMISGQKIGEDRYYELRYENLVTEPEGTLSKLCHWLDIDYTESMLKHHEGKAAQQSAQKSQDLRSLVAKPVDASRAYSWRKTLSRPQVADFESVSGSLLASLGYEVTGFQVFFGLRLSRTILESLKPYFAQKLMKFSRGNQVGFWPMDTSKDWQGVKNRDV